MLIVDALDPNQGETSFVNFPNCGLKIFVYNYAVYTHLAHLDGLSYFTSGGAPVGNIGIA